MRVPLSWLREYVKFDLPADELAELFSLHSQEVDGVYHLGVADGEVVVGEVVEFGPHPNADRLFVAKVDLGGEEVQVVAGASNPYPGARIPVVLPGSTLADGTKLKKTKLRGMESYGMMMSERELGVSPDHDGILLLEGSPTVGRPVADYFPVRETVLDLEITPNRPDMAGMIGVARDLAAVLDTELRIPEPAFEKGGEPTSDYGLRVEDGDLCPRFDLRRVSGLAVGGEMPLEVRQRVYAAGMRPIGPIVDATNYAMLETGQPIHPYESGRISGGIVVRRARDGEEIALLDGSTRVLDGEMLLIADEEKPLGVAGVMGGEDGEVGGDATDVLIEVANFAGRNILETSSRLGLRTEASGRFERGLDPELVGYAMDRVTQLLTEHAGGRSSSDTLSHYPEAAERREVPLRLSRAELLLGMTMTENEAAAKLRALGCEIQRQDGFIRASVPTFRRDLAREADLIEEVGRLLGLDRVPEEVPAVALPGGLTDEQKKVRLLRRLLADLGLAEAMLYPFGPDRWRKSLGLENGEAALRLENPLSAEASVLRSTLLPGLLDAASRNRSFGMRGGALFEVGRVFEPVRLSGGSREEALQFRVSGEVGGEQPDAGRAAAFMGVAETPKVGVVLAGDVEPAGWNTPGRRAGFFEAKGIVERLVPGAAFEARTEPFLHPGRCAAVLVDGQEAGWVGEVHPETADRFDLGGWPVAAFELDVRLCEPDPELRFEPFVSIPAVSRDLAVVVDRDVRVGDMLAAVDAVGGHLLTERRVFDVYEGEQVPEGQKSVAFGFTFQGEETLTDEVVDEEIRGISTRLAEEFGARVRGA